MLSSAPVADAALSLLPPLHLSGLFTSFTPVPIVSFSRPLTLSTLYARSITSVMHFRNLLLSALPLFSLVPSSNALLGINLDLLGLTHLDLDVGLLKNGGRFTSTFRHSLLAATLMHSGSLLATALVNVSRERSTAMTLSQN